MSKNRDERRREWAVQQEKEDADRRKRWADLWNVPEQARDAYLRMEDNFGPASVLEFTAAMLPGEVLK